MSDFRVAIRYAKAVFELAIERNSLEQIHKDMKYIVSLSKGSPDLALMLKSPVIYSSKKLQVLTQIFESEVDALTMQFMQLLCRKNREAFLASSAAEFIKLYNKHNGIQLAEVTTSMELTSELRAQIIDNVKKISGKDKIELSEKVDKNLIGGYILKVDDRQIDDSVKTRLKDLRKDLVLN
ncbi:MAG: ATP synthase F1 subunit delta [Bernardetiaceae bacterium]|nr:ATP synthase F1 subunit delta [Bernardetiaceae bacterium]